MPDFDATNFPSIEVLNQPVAKLFISYYWLPSLVSFSIYLFSYHKGTNSELIQWLFGGSFYLLFFIGGSMAKSFLQRKIVYTFIQLRKTGSLSEQALQTLAKEFQMRLNNRVGDIFGIAGGLLIFVYYWPNYWSLSNFLLAAIDMLWGYVTGVAIWKTIVTAREVGNLGLKGQLRIRPFHPDGCAGLEAIGRFCLSLSLILISIGIFLVYWIIYAHWFNPDFGNSTYYLNLEPWFKWGLVVLMIVSFLAFFYPMITVHRLMKEQAMLFEGKLGTLAESISDFEETLLSQSSQMGYEQLENQYAKIESLRNVYSQRRRIPTWPVNFQTLATFFGAQIPLWIGTLTSVLDLLQKLGSS